MGFFGTKTPSKADETSEATGLNPKTNGWGVVAPFNLLDWPIN